MDLAASVANKRLTAQLNSLDATLTKNSGGGALSPCLLTSLPHYLVTSLLHNRRCSARPLQHGSGRAGFFADVTHSNDASWIPDSCGAGDVADVFSVESQERFRFGHGVAGKSEPHALTVYLAARPHALHDFLARVAAFGVADVAVLQAGFVRDLFFAEVIAKPRHALSETGRAQRRVAHRRAFVPTSRIRKNLPKLRQLFPLGEKLRPRDSSRGALRDPAGNRTDFSAVGGKFFKLREVGAGNLFDKGGGLRTLQRQRAVAWRLIDEGHVIHDDVFFENFDQPLANHGIRDTQEPVGKRVRLDLGQNVALRIQEQGNDAVTGGEVLDVVG